MLNRISDKLTESWCQKNIIPYEMKEIYRYGLEVLISNVLSSLTMLIVGILFFDIFSTVVFLLIFILLRSYCGGYHADTYLKCFITTNITYLFTMSCACFLSVNLFTVVLTMLIGVPLLYLRAPVENINKPLDTMEKRKYKRISLIIFLILIAISICLCITGMHRICSAIIYTLVSTLILIPVGIIKNKEVKQ